LRERGQCRQRFVFFHSSRDIEMKSCRQVLFHRLLK